MNALRRLRWVLALTLLVSVALLHGCGGADSGAERRAQAAAVPAAAAAEPTFRFYATTFADTQAYTQSLFSVTAANGHQELLGSRGKVRAANAIDVDPLTGSLYGVDGSGTPGALLSIDPVTGASTAVATVRNAAGQTIVMGGLSFAGDGTLYVSTPSSIGRVDRSSYRYTELFVVPSTVSVTGIEISPAGVLYAAYHPRAAGAQTLVSIDLATMTVVREVEIKGTMTVGDFDFAPDGYLYHTTYSFWLARIHPGTGVQALVGLGELGALAALASVSTFSTTVLFDWAERSYPQFFPSHQANLSADPYTYRFYPETGNYVGVAGTTVAVLGPISGGQVLNVGQLTDFGCRIVPASCSAPGILGQPASVAVSAATPAVFTVGAGGIPVPGYQWQISSDGKTFSDIAGANTASYTLATTTLADHGKQFRVVVSNAAGSNTSAAAVLSVYPALGSYAFAALTAKMTVARAMHTATTLDDGKVLITGGTSSRTFPGAALNTAELYDPTTNRFQALATRMASPRVQHTATRLLDGKVLLAGGQVDTNDGDGSASAELYDPVTQTFSSLPATLASPRGGHAGALLADGKVLLVGGFNRGAGTLVSDAELYDPITRSFKALPAKMVLLTEGHRATPQPGGKVLVTGGASSGVARTVPELFDPVTQTFAAHPARMSTVRGALEATRLPTGTILISGGATTRSSALVTALKSAEVFDSSTDGFSSLAVTMTVERAAHAAALLSDGSVLLVGGMTSSSGSSFSLLDSAEIFKPVTETPPAPAPIVVLTAASATAPAGSQIALLWSSTNASACTASGAWSGSKGVAGTESVQAGTSAGERSFTLSCTGSGGSASASVSVNVTAIGCAQIGGVWTETARVTGSCVPEDSYDSGTVTGRGTIVQNGCDISYTVAGIPRTGKVNGFTMTITGPAAVAGPEITLTANTLTITGSISADARRITATGVGQLGGVFNDGFSQMCTLRSTSTMTR